MPVPNTFANATTSIPLSQLDANFATAITLGNTAIQLGNTVSTLNNMTLANVTISSGTVSVANATVTGNVTMSGGNLSFTGTGQRITGDFSNATIANRTMFQSNTTNGDTRVGALPNGTATGARFELFNNSDTTNSGRLSFVMSSTEAAISSAINGSGTYLPILMYTSGAERMRIDTNGKVGIGTSNPGARLQVDTATTDDGISITNTSSANTTAKQPRLLFRGTDTVGTGKDAASLVVVPAEANYVGASLAFYTRGSDTNAEHMRIDSSGNLLVGTSSTLFASSHAFVNSGAAVLGLRNSLSTAGKYWQVGPDANSSFKVYNQDTVGMFLADGGTSWTSSSDERQKNIIEPISDATKKVASLRAVIGSYKSDETNKRRSFLIAQDVQQVLPEAVTETPDGFLGVAYSDVIPLLVAAIQELSAKVAALEGKQ